MVRKRKKWNKEYGKKEKKKRKRLLTSQRI